MKRWMAAALMAACMMVVTNVSGCGDDVRTVKQSETVHESPPDVSQTEQTMLVE
ncbi:MAG: hypothetical protein JXB13_19070 [Phycisphaerae bacterium]|nr:hypothetical protein [Phycisphaerae bacterium]